MIHVVHFVVLQVDSQTPPPYLKSPKPGQEQIPSQPVKVIYPVLWMNLNLQFDFKSKTFQDLIRTLRSDHHRADLQGQTAIHTHNHTCGQLFQKCCWIVGGLRTKRSCPVSNPGPAYCGATALTTVPPSPMCSSMTPKQYVNLKTNIIQHLLGSPVRN